jgi:hypothetical protein
MPWNNDGLHIKFDLEATEDVNSGSYCYAEGNRFIMEVDVKLADLDGGAVNFPTYQMKVKNGSTLIEAEMVVAETAAGGTSIDIGLYDTEGASAIDANGFFAGVTNGSMTKGSVITGAGALIGTDMTDNGIINVTTVGTFTAGRVKARLVFEVL